MGIAIITGHFRTLFILFSIVLIHELGHYAMARFFRWRIHRIVLLPFGGIVEVEEHGNKPIIEEFFVVIAGPLQHVWLMLAGYICLHFSLWSPSFYTTFFAMNLMILVFNLLPIWPLDGGKLLFLLLAILTPYKRAHLLTLSFSTLFLVLFMCGSIIFYQLHLNLLVILLFLFVAIYTEWRHHPYIFFRFLLELYESELRVTKRRKKIFILPNLLLKDVLKRFYKDAYHEIVVIQSSEKSFRASEEDVLLAFFKHKKIHETIADLYRIK